MGTLSEAYLLLWGKWKSGFQFLIVFRSIEVISFLFAFSNLEKEKTILLQTNSFFFFVSCN